MAEKPKDEPLSKILPELDFTPPPALPEDVLAKLRLKPEEKRAVDFVCAGAPKLFKLINQVEDRAGRAFLKAIEKTITEAAAASKTPEQVKADLAAAFTKVIEDHPNSAKPLREMVLILGKDGGEALKELVDKKYIQKGWQTRLFSFFDPKSETIDPQRTAEFRHNILESCSAAAMQSIFPQGIPKTPQELINGISGVYTDYHSARQKLQKWSEPAPFEQDASLADPAGANRTILARAAPEGDQQKGIA